MTRIRTTGRSNSRGLGPVSKSANDAVAPGPEWRFVCRREVFRVFGLGGTYGVYTSGNCLKKTKLVSVLPLGFGDVSYPASIICRTPGVHYGSPGWTFGHKFISPHRLTTSRCSCTRSLCESEQPLWVRSALC